MGAVVGGLLLIMVVIALAQARSKMIERLALLGLALTGITGLVTGLISLLFLWKPAGFRGSGGGFALVGAAIAFAALAVISIFRPKP